jgi:hypothetical protein
VRGSSGTLAMHGREAIVLRSSADPCISGFHRWRIGDFLQGSPRLIPLQGLCYASFFQEAPIPRFANPRIFHMSFKCPACTSVIQHGKRAKVPFASIIYRCSVCRLDLIFDPGLKQMRPAPFGPDKPKPNVG